MPNIPFRIARDFKKADDARRTESLEITVKQRDGGSLRVAQLIVLAIGGCALTWAILLGARLI